MDGEGRDVAAHELQEAAHEDLAFDELKSPSCSAVAKMTNGMVVAEDSFFDVADGAMPWQVLAAPRGLSGQSFR